jgi:hypothetical protein
MSTLNTPCEKCGEMQHWTQRKDRSFGYKCLSCEGKIMGLNIIDAVKSGKRFRRKLPYKQTHWYENESPLLLVGFNRENILATDWEIEERKIEITESEFDAAVAISFRCKYLHEEAMEELKERLFGK